MKQKKSSTKSVVAMGPALARSSYVSPYGTPEMLDYMRQCEAREWIRR